MRPMNTIFESYPALRLRLPFYRPDLYANPASRQEGTLADQCIDPELVGMFCSCCRSVALHQCARPSDVFPYF